MSRFVLPEPVGTDDLGHASTEGYHRFSARGCFSLLVIILRGRGAATLGSGFVCRDGGSGLLIG